MTMREEMDWEDAMGFPRPTRNPYHCTKCGKTFQTREVYHNHNCVKPEKKIRKEDVERKRLLQESLEKFKKEHRIK